MENEKNGISLGDVWYIVKKYWIMMLAVIIAATAVGAAYSVMRKQQYRASTSVMIKADLGGDKAEKSDIQYSSLYTPTILEVMGSAIIMERAGVMLGENVSVSGAKFTAKQNNDQAWVATVTYVAGDGEEARDKLLAIINSFNDYAQEKEDNGSYKNFQGRVELRVLSETPAITNVYSATKTTVLFFVVGIVAALLVSLAMYFINDRITTVDRVESISGKKNILSIVSVKGRKKENQTELLHMNLEKLADTLVFLHEGDSDKVYQIQSSVPGEGKTTVSANLAIALGAIGKKVLVLECDFRKPNLHRAFKLKRQLGMTDYFKDEKKLEQVIKKTEYQNVYAVTCGSTVDNPTILFMSGKFGSLISQARDNFDFVLLDCPPVGGASDFICISRSTDATILVVGCDRVSSRQLKGTVSDLEESGANVLGTVFNFAGRKKHRDYYYKSYKENVAE